MSLVENLKLRNRVLDYINQAPIITFDQEQSSREGGEYRKSKLGDEELWSLRGRARIVADGPGARRQPRAGEGPSG